MRSGRTQEQSNNRVHQHYTAWAVGDGALTEFALPKSVRRLGDLMVTVAGLVKRPTESGHVYDYAVRGLTPGYDGDANRVKFVAAPAAAAAIGFFLIAD